MKQLSIVLTGNHHTPAIELINQLKSDPQTDWRIYYLSHLHPQDTHIKNTIIKELKIKFYPLKSGKFNRYHIFKSLADIPSILIAICRTTIWLSRLRPSIIISFGGYSSTPVIIAGWLAGIPSISHEQTLTLSLSTKINQFFVKKIALSFPLPQSSTKFILTGNLLRRQIFQKKSASYHHLKPRLKQKPLLYITGGNQGSQIINQTIQTILPQLTKKYTIIHQVGNLGASSPSSPAYHPSAYIGLNDIGWVLNHARLIISRAGANTCQEITTLGKPAVLIPLPGSQQNEQLQNALWAKKNNPAPTLIIPQNRLSGLRLLKAIHRLTSIKYKPLSPQPSPNLKLLQLIYQIINDQ